MNRSFIRQDQFLYLKIALGLCCISIFLYVVDDPVGPPSGNSWLGYTLGTVGTLIIVWLVWFGVRKRQYTGTRYSLTRWLSAHVYMGTALLVIGTLHCGFQFDDNIHTMAYILMVLTILSGMIGVYYYLTVPGLISANIKNSNAQQLHETIDQIDRKALEIARQIDSHVHEMMAYTIHTTLKERRHPSKKVLMDMLRVGETIKEASKACYCSLTKEESIAPSDTPVSDLKQKDPSDPHMRLSAIIIDLSFNRSPGEKLQQLLDLINEKATCIHKLHLDRVYNRRLKIWLMFHVPLSLATLIALVIHIVSVFYY
ncbi:MAG: hypothetical protein EBT06_09200 [Gammaproteobacteria bacterium]|nr:hypothetical protein [Gammaproteobacteria bacterium]NBT45084.1 hypothetical protein [Gammaproteobacteria bacterium]